MFKSALIAILLYAGPALAEDCLGLFVNGAAPVVLNEKMKEKVHPLCYREYGLLYSGVSYGPIWSADHLTAGHLKAGANVARPHGNAFHEDLNVPPDERSILDDYKRSGYDRGHMSPNGDMSSAQAKEESFSLANMVPQAPCHNEVLWEGIESAVRTYAAKVGEVYVVTGPAFSGGEISSLHGRVLVPTNIWKAVYIPSQNAAAAYWTPNDNSQKWEVVSIAKLKELTGIDVFPGIDDKVKQTATALPSPEPPKHNCRTNGERR